MKHIGIDCRSSGKRGGSGRTFSVQTETGKLSMRVDEVRIHINDCPIAHVDPIAAAR